jgi:PilZ domain-containing protein
MLKDNRIHPRLLVRLLGEYQVDGTGPWHPGTVLDLSAGGATLIALQRIAPQRVVRLRFTLPHEGGGPIQVETLVLRADPLAHTGGNVQYREALHFLDLHGECYERVRRYVFERQEGQLA